jgi:MFS transporter, ACDE family, multidrug resistance protein
VVAPRLQHRFGTVPTLLVNLFAIAVLLAVMAHNTLITETVMKAAPVDRGVASAAYSFVRFSGGAVAPWLAGTLGEQISVHLPFWLGAAALLVGVGVLAGTRRHRTGTDVYESEPDDVTDQAAALTVGSES